MGKQKRQFKIPITLLLLSAVCLLGLATIQYKQDLDAGFDKLITLDDQYFIHKGSSGTISQVNILKFSQHISR